MFNRCGTARFWITEVSALAVLCLLCPAFLSAAAGANTPGSPPRSFPGGIENIVNRRPYLDADAAKRNPMLSGRTLEAVRKSCPPEFLPDSLRPQAKDNTKREGDAGEAMGGGAGGWTKLARAYRPSSSPDVNYEVSPFDNLFDSSGRLHQFYAKTTTTDLSRAPDVPGFRTQNVKQQFYAVYTEGSWSEPVALTRISGLQDSDLHWYDVDADGYVHVVYSKWTWGRDESLPAGNWFAYQHEGENLWYRCRAPDGGWSEPKSLTDLSGAWNIDASSFVSSRERIYGTWQEVFNRETAPPSHRARLVYIDGVKGDWSARKTLKQWDYSINAGDRSPTNWPLIEVSPVTGELCIVYSVFAEGAAPQQDRVNAHGLLRSPAGSWSSAASLTPGANNTAWMPLFGSYSQTGADFKMMVFRSNMQVTDTIKPFFDACLIRHGAGGWEPPFSISRLNQGEGVEDFDVSYDPWGYWHFAFSSAKYRWDPALAQWEEAGGKLQYVRETSEGASSPATVMPYQSDRYTLGIDTALDMNEGVHILFETHRHDVYEGSHYEAYYSSNVSGSGGARFSSPTRLSSNSNRVIDDVCLSANHAMGVLASWSEKRLDGTGRPLAGALYSRYLDAGKWSGLKNVAVVPGSSDIVHVIDESWPSYYTFEKTLLGEQQILFETARYNSGTATYHTFRKYFCETTNGIWSSPDLVSAVNASGEPGIQTDANRRVHAIFSLRDPGTDNSVLSGAMQPDPTPPATTYYFAEGTTRSGFQEWICIENPGTNAAAIDVTYMLGSGEANIEQKVAVPAQSRLTVDVNAAVGSEKDVSARVASDRLIVAERPMYFDYRGWTGGHDSMGSTSTGRVWYFAEGTTRTGFAEYLTLQNPSDGNAEVDITYMKGDGKTLAQKVTVNARSRATVDVNAAVGEGQDVSMKVESPDVAIVAERPMYFDYGGWTDGHNAMGSRVLDDLWYFAEGTTREGFDTYLCVENPSSSAGAATITYLLEDGSTKTRSLDLPATSRQTVKVNDDVGAGRDVSIVVEATTLVLAERPMYFDYHGFADGGHVAVGANAPRNAWYFAEGTTREGFDEWLSLENPGQEGASARIKFMMSDGSVVEKTVPVPAHTRVTVDVALAVGRGKDVSVEIWSDRGIIAERPMYFAEQDITPKIWPGGTNVLGL